VLHTLWCRAYKPLSSKDILEFRGKRIFLLETCSHTSSEGKPGVAKTGERRKSEVDYVITSVAVTEDFRRILGG
jgi:hypothetical protein